MNDIAKILSNEMEGSLAGKFVLPPSFESKSQEEREIHLNDLLRSELSESGLDVLREEAQFGPLQETFPDQSQEWATLFRVPVEECFAFKMQRAGLTAELVLHRSEDGWRVLRCNNVSQMALPLLGES